MPVMRNFDVFFDLLLNIRLSKQSRSWWSETPSGPLWRHCNVYNEAWHVRTIESREYLEHHRILIIVCKCSQLSSVSSNKSKIMMTTYVIPYPFFPSNIICTDTRIFMRQSKFSYNFFTYDADMKKSSFIWCKVLGNFPVRNVIDCITLMRNINQKVIKNDKLLRFGKQR